MLFVHEINRGPAKPATSHPCAIYSVDLLSDFTHQIELVGADLVIITEACVRLSHQLPKALQIMLLERIARLQHTRVLRHNVPATSIDHFRQLRLVLFELLDRNVAQRTDL